MLSSTSIEAARKQLKTKFKVDSKVIVKIPNPLPKYLGDLMKIIKVDLIGSIMP